MDREKLHRLLRLGIEKGASDIHFQVGYLPLYRFHGELIELRYKVFTAKDTEFGTAYGAWRPAEADTYYWRIGYAFFPFYAMQAAGEMGPDVKMNAYVPMDDDHTLQWEVFYRTDGPPRPQRRVPINRTNEVQESGRGGKYIPQGTGWYDRFVLEQNLENDYFVDREAQKNWESYSGIPGIRQQDMAVTETMGPIYNRSREHLGTSDSMIIRTRHR